MTTHQIATSVGRPMPLRPSCLNEYWDLATMIGKAGLVPGSMKTQQAVTLALLAGAEVGLGPMQSLQSFAVIRGKVSIYGDALIALARAHPEFRGMQEFYEGEGDDLVAVCRVKRGEEEWAEQRFSVADARKAGLWEKAGPWTQYGKRMLQMRARGWLLRAVFADALAGMKTVDEVRDYDGPPVDAPDRMDIDVTHEVNDEDPQPDGENSPPPGDSAEFGAWDGAIDTSQPIPPGTEQEGQAWADQSRAWLLGVIAAPSSAYELAHAEGELARRDSKIVPLPLDTPIGDCFGALTYAGALTGQRDVLEQVATEGTYGPQRRATAAKALMTGWGGDIDLARAVPRGAHAGVSWGVVVDIPGLRRKAAHKDADPCEKAHALERLEQIDAALAAACDEVDAGLAAAKQSAEEDQPAEEASAEEAARRRVLRDVVVLAVGEHAADNGMSATEGDKCVAWALAHISTDRQRLFAEVDWKSLRFALDESDMDELAMAIEAQTAVAAE